MKYIEIAYSCPSAHTMLDFSLHLYSVDLGGLGVTCSPRDPRFAGSNPADVDGFFQDVKKPEHKSSGKDFELGSRV